MTAAKNLKKICRQGLKPSASNSKFSHPDRVYLFNNATQEMLMSFCYARFRKDTASREASICILKILSSKLVNSHMYKSGKCKFYIDPLFEDIGKSANAVYTYGNISRQLIEDNALLLTIDTIAQDVVKSQQISLSKLNVN